MAELLIATPAFDPRVTVQTYASVVAMDKCGMEVEAYCPSGYTVVEARTRTAQRAVGSGAEWLMCVDSDVRVPEDALSNMLSHGVDVCFGYYSKGSRGDGATCLCDVGRRNYDSFIFKDALHEMRDEGTSLLEVRGGGFGCVLVRTSVFTRIGEPWFDYTWSRAGARLSEDYYFCTRCRSAGVKVYADTRVDCGHVKEVLL